MSIRRSIRLAIEPHRRNEAGTGVVGTFLGAIVFLAFLALAAHTLVGLYATSVLTAITWDEARQAAQSGDQDAAKRSLLARLDGFEDVTVEFGADIEKRATLTVRAERPSLLPTGLMGTAGVSHIERTAVVRSEKLR